MPEAHPGVLPVPPPLLTVPSAKPARGGLAEAGFIDIVVVERPEWLERELAMWREAVELDPGDDPALHDEGVEVLAHAASNRQFIASATA